MAISRQILREVLLDNQKDVESYAVQRRNFDLDSFNLLIFIGVRRCGKSYLLYQKMQSMLARGYTWADMLYLDFEDIRLEGFDSGDFNLILECHQEMYGRRPMLFLDEVQNIPGWEKFARNLADKKYSVFITGSNARMLSQDIMSSLGGRYVPIEVFPLSLCEYLSFRGIPSDEMALAATESRAAFYRAYGEYFRWGGLPEAINLGIKRNYLSSLFQKIYLGDIVQHNGISNAKALRLMIKKISESIMHPLSYNRIANVLTGISGKISVPTVSSYVSSSENAWLLLRLRNICSAFSERENICKYYLIDNGLISLQLLGCETILFENMVSLELFRRYGHDADNERVWFYSDNVEVDFYVPEDKLAVQASYSVREDAARDREIEALKKLPKAYSCDRRLIVTYDEEGSFSDEYGVIEIIPFWKWALR